MQNENKDLTVGEKIILFVQKNKKGILISTGAFVFLLAALIIFLSLQDVFHNRAIAEADDLNRRYDDMRYQITEDFKSSELDTLLSDLEKFGTRKSGYPGSKAWSIIAQIHSARKDWSKSKEAWLNAAQKGNNTYLGPISLFNAAAAAEEQGNIEQAIELLQKCISHQFEFPAAARAQFSIGRLYEKQSNYTAAVEAYRFVLIDWQDIPIWQHLARSRITVIEMR
ncbi:MAG: tetratricopeptide repeat protein [Treponema sp.]|nr:tetratricopeptide repeat protein [Treponema sp.]